MSNENIKDGLVPQYISGGEEKFYRSIIFLALQKLILIENGNYKGLFPHLEYLDYYDKLIILYRREGDEVYRNIAKMLRKAGNKIYRIMLKKNMIKKDDRFFNVV